MSEPGGPQEIDRNAAVAALATLTDVSQSRVSSVVLIAKTSSGGDEIAQLRPTQAAASALTTVVQRFAQTFADSEVIDYGPTTLASDGQIMWMPTDAVPLLSQLVTDSDDLASLPVFSPDDGNISRVRIAAARVESDSGAVVFVQSLSANEVVARSKKVGVVVRRGVIDVPPDDVVLIGRDFVAVVTPDVVFFSNRRRFQRLFGLMEELRARAEETFQLVTAQLRIEGLDEMSAAVVGSAAMLGKMASIQSKLDEYPQYKSAMTMPRLVEFVGQHPECGVEIVGEGEEARLVFRNDPQHRFKILKLLDDDYLRSELTTLEYEANSKSAPLA